MICFKRKDLPVPDEGKETIGSEWFEQRQYLKMKLTSSSSEKDVFC